jgi:glycosyltransferase involved in cell wall biosynthesis
MSAGDGHSDVAILVCTRDRCRLLCETLASIAQLVIPAGWRCEVLVVDNDSTDETRATVFACAAGYPLPLRYVHEPALGKSNAMNAGIAASYATVFACTDDDVAVSPEWLQAGCEPLLTGSGEFAYTGGPVRPIWDGQCPDWLPSNASDLWGTIAILDYGTRPFVFEDEAKVPLGANFAIRRDLIERIGGFVPTLGRTTSRTLLGQELPELFRRARAAGTRGRYVPSMEVFHHIPAERLTTSYFRRWWFGKGISRARLDRIHPITELGVDLRTTSHLAGVPRFMIGDAGRDLWKWLRARGRGAFPERIRLETRLAYFLGYALERQRERNRTAAAQTAPLIDAAPLAFDQDAASHRPDALNQWPIPVGERESD